ncbi:MAG: hypothetical protein A2330_09425 [Ignavibacteria bacterium RIFOXYB2_FULL_36_7]|nr:MAG: hypothetical protein A2330_09425 [Ignavibacteria bacterium RIFOXYB2_FULL_36_7]
MKFFRYKKRNYRKIFIMGFCEVNNLFEKIFLKHSSILYFRILKYGFRNLIPFISGKLQKIPFIRIVCKNIG